MASLTWVLGIRALPAAVHEDEPSIVVWLTDDQVLSFRHLDDEAPSDDELKETFEEAVLNGTRPKKIRVEDGPLAKRVRGLFKGIEVEIGRTQAIDRFVATVVETALADRREGLALMDAAPEALRPELTGLCVDLEETSPWDLVPVEPLVVKIPSLDLLDGRLGTMGDDGDTFGLMIFFRPEDEAAFANAEELAPEDAPRCLAAKLSELPNEDGSFFDAFVPKAFDHGDSVPCDPRELRIVIAATKALCRFTAEHEDALVDDEKLAAGIEATLDVEVGNETIAVTLRAQSDG